MTTVTAAGRSSTTPRHALMFESTFAMTEPASCSTTRGWPFDSDLTPAGRPAQVAIRRAQRIAAKPAIGPLIGGRAEAVFGDAAGPVSAWGRHGIVDVR